MRFPPLITLFLLTACPYIDEPDPREDVPLEGDTDVDADADADADTDTDADADVDCPTPEGDLQDQLGDTLITGNTCQGGDDFPKNVQDCGGSTGPDVAFAWTAPYAGTFNISLAGSNYDTVLMLHSACPEMIALACNDDDGVNTTSAIEREFAAGQPVVIAVEGYNQNCGNFEVSINEVGR